MFDAAASTTAFDEKSASCLELSLNRSILLLSQLEFTVSLFFPGHRYFWGFAVALFFFSYFSKPHGACRPLCAEDTRTWNSRLMFRSPFLGVENELLRILLAKPASKCCSCLLDRRSPHYRFISQEIEDQLYNAVQAGSYCG